MKIGIIGAMQMEVNKIKEAICEPVLEEYSGVTFVSGTLDGNQVVAAVCGVGKVFAAICAEAMILKYGVDMIINVGVAGTLTSKLHVLDVAVADQVVQHDMDTSALGDPLGLLSGINKVYIPTDERMRNLLAECLEKRQIHFEIGTIATGDRFIHNKEVKDDIVAEFGAIAAEMEGGSIGHVCYMNKIPFAIIRSISDGDGGNMDYQQFAEKAAQVSVQIIFDFIQALG